MLFKHSFLTALFLVTAFVSFAQADKYLTVGEATRIETYLSSDEMRGRKPGTPEMEKAAAFIGEEFKKAGLKFYDGLQNYQQAFSNVRTRLVGATGNADGTEIEAKNIIALSTDSLIKITEASGFEKQFIGNTENLLARATTIFGNKKNTVVFVNSFFANDFNKLKRLNRDGNKLNYSVVFVLGSIDPVKYNFEIRNKITETNYANVIGMLPGKSKKNEFVVFSGHYDHLGVTNKPNAAGDSIYNGANDDAAGTTAVIMLANHFAKIKNNERTIVFVAFTAEESGGFGSQYFSKNIDPDKVVAMFNLEMIGTESKWGKNSAYITGYERSDFGAILQKNVAGTKFRFEPDPYPTQNLFYRSDNATLAALGVPAHTISTSKMDSEPNYHKLSDEVSTLDLDNMTEIMKAIAAGSKSIISGADTPARVEKVK